MRFSIITATYNSESTIVDTLNSVLSQNHRDIEHIIIDGNSMDKTIKIVESYFNKYQLQGKVIKYITEDDLGIYDAINKGINIAQGEIVGILNSDDYFYDNNVIIELNDIFTNNFIDCLYGDIKIVSNKTMKTKRNWVSSPYKKGNFSKSWTPPHPSFYCKKSIYILHGTYKVNYRIAADVELMYRFLEKKSVISYYYNRYFVNMRSGGVSTKNILSTFIITKEMKNAFHENGERLNVIRYLFYKIFKVRQFFSKK